jgi:hypothetical protein
MSTGLVPSGTLYRPRSKLARRLRDAPFKPVASDEQCCILALAPPNGDRQGHGPEDLLAWILQQGLNGALVVDPKNI